MEEKIDKTKSWEGINEGFVLKLKLEEKMNGSPEPLNCCAPGLKGSVESSSSALNTSPTACPYPRHGSRQYSEENRRARS